MITFHELRIGAAGEAAPTPEIEAAIASHAASDTLSVMMCGFEPFEHPDLPHIVIALAEAGVKRIGMRTSAAGLMNPRDAGGCIDAGVRVFEVPVEPAAFSHTAAPKQSWDVTLRGIKQAKTIAAELGVTIFFSALIHVDAKTPQAFMLEAAQAAIAAGVDALRITCSDPARYLNQNQLHVAHSLAAQAGVTLFGDGCDAYLQGARLYEVVSSAASLWPPSRNLREGKREVAP